MGVKNTTSKDQVTIPPDVLARYNAVNAQAQTTAATPFQRYGNNASDFVAQVNPQQTEGINTINQGAGAFQPYLTQATSAINNAGANASGYNTGATSALNTGFGAAQPLNTQALGQIGAGIAGASPLNGLASAFTFGSGQAVDPTNLDQAAIQKYFSPYLQSVIDPTQRALMQQNAQQQSQLTGSAASSGAFGGDRFGVGASNLAYQQNLANAQTIAGLYNQNYSQALGTAQQQQGVDLGARQADRAALGQAGSGLAGIGNQIFNQGVAGGQATAGIGNQIFGQAQGLASGLQGIGNQVFNQGLQSSEALSNLGTTAQTNAINAGQAQMGAGAVQQATQQKGIDALVNQFMQEKGYPFQVAQFLANIAEGTGALSGSTTTTTQPTSFFSDERLKENIKEVGKLRDGQKIYTYNYKNEPNVVRIGLMAQEVEKLHPEAIGEQGGYKTVDYGKATRDAVKRAGGGSVQPYEEGGLYGGQQGADGPYGIGLVPNANYKLMLPEEMPAIRQSDLGQVIKGLGGMDDKISALTHIKDSAGEVGHWLKDRVGGDSGYSGYGLQDDGGVYAAGGLVPRRRYANGGGPYDPAHTGYVPDNEDNAPKQLPTAGAPGGGDQQSGLGKAAGTIGNVVSTAATIAKILPFIGLKDGGLVPRHGYAFDGAVTDAPAVPAGADEAPRSVRNNNPGNIKVSPWTEKQPGFSGADPDGFAVFDRPESGVAAADRLLTHYGETGHDTPRAVVSRWSPDDSADNYTKYVSNVLGASPDTKLDMTNPDQRAKLFSAMSAFEAGRHGPKETPKSSGLAPSVAPGDAGERSLVAQAQGGLEPQPNIRDVVANDASAAPERHGVGAWIDKNKDWLTPVASGLATMASSPSLFAGSAILQGIGGGFLTKYEMGQQAKQLALKGRGIDVSAAQAQNEAIRNALQIAQQRFVRNPGATLDKQWFDTRTGEYISDAEHGRRYNDMLNYVGNRPIAGGPASAAQLPVPGPTTSSGAVTAAPVSPQAAPQTTAAPIVPAAPPSSAAPAAAKSPEKMSVSEKAAAGMYSAAALTSQMVHPVDDSQVAPEQRLSAMQENQRSLTARGMFPEADAQQKQIDGVLDGSIVPRTVSGEPFYGYRSLGQERAVQNEQIGSYLKQKEQTNQEISDFAGSTYPQTAQALSSLAKAYQETNTNRKSTDIADAIGDVASFPVVRSVLPDALKEYQGAVDVATKASTLQAISQALKNGNETDKKLGAALATVANPTLEPAARYHVVMQAQALLDQQAAFYKDWQRDQGNVANATAYKNDWFSENPVEKFEAQARDEIPYFAGMTQKEMDQHPKSTERPQKYVYGKYYRFPRPAPNGQLGGYYVGDESGNGRFLKTKPNQ